MAVRHRIPTVFNIYMVDVLCCALGCVILLWQVSHQEAEKQTKEAEKQTAAAHTRGDDLQQSLDQLKSYASEIDKLRVNLDAKEKLAVVLQSEKDAITESSKLTQAFLDKLKIEHKDLAAKSNLTGAELADKIKANAELLLKIAAAENRAKLLEKDLNDKSTVLTQNDKALNEKKLKLEVVERLANLLGKEKLEMLAKLKTADLRVRILESDLTRLLGESADSQKKVADLVKTDEAMKLRMNISAKDLETLQAMVAKLNSDSAETMRRAKIIQATAENRFAGITLTGKKVVFMVDMSGSMELTDIDTADPDKWPFLCDTIARILLSLVDVTHYQVILFSDKVSYPLANDGRWFEAKDRLADAKGVADRLKQIKPKGPTNMYAAFDEAFKFRAMGMDTIYVFSDGLPNDGPALPAGVDRSSEQAITTAHSKLLRAKLKGDWNRTVPLSSRVRINTIGFFYESPDVGAFLWALAREHDGSFVGMNR